MQNFPARLTVDLRAVAHNVRTVHSLLSPNVEIMSIVKANAYGTGMLEVTKTCLQNGATWIGVAKASEAIRLRALLDAQGLDARIFTWIYTQGAPVEQLIEARIDISLGALWQVEAVAKAAQEMPAYKPRVQLEVETGFGRSGFCQDADFAQALHLLKRYHEAGVLEFEGVWSHLAAADSLDDASRALTYAQKERFENFVAQVQDAGLKIRYKHLCASAGIVNYPDMHYDLVRPGIILYGHSPNPLELDAHAHGFKPVAKLEAPIVAIKDLPAGSGISYGHRYHTKQDTRIALVPLGYADGIARTLSGVDAGDRSESATFAPNSGAAQSGAAQSDSAGIATPITGKVHSSGAGAAHLGAPVRVGGKIARIAGRVCMDQFMLDIGADSNARAGDWATLYGFEEGDPRVEDWAQCAGTIPYEILTSIPTLAAVNYLR